MSIPALYSAQRKQRALKAAKRKAKAARIAAARQITTTTGEALTLPPRWTLKTTSEKLRIELHAAIRERDGAVCISCGKTGLIHGLRGTWNAGHMFAVGPYPSLRFHPLNIASQCSACNCDTPRFGGRRGNVAAYIAEFIRRHGVEVFQTLDSARLQPRQWTAPELYELLTVLRREGLAGYQGLYFRLTGWDVKEKAA